MDDQNIDKDQNKGHNNNMDDVVFEDATDSDRMDDKLKKIKAELKRCDEERKEYLDGWQRAKADFVNARKRLEEERGRSVTIAKEDIVISVLPVLDSFDMAFNTTASFEHLDKNWVAGMQHIRSQLASILEEHGVTVVDPIGETFDPNIHESIEVKDVSQEDEDHTIVGVVQKGYTMDGKLLRAPKVIVGRYAEN